MLGIKLERNDIMVKLVEMLYERSEFDFKRGTFRVRGDTLEIIPANEHTHGLRIEFFGDEIDRISEIDTLTGSIVANKKSITIFPASHFVTNDEKLLKAISNIKEELKERQKYFLDNNKPLEEERIRERTNYDMEASC